ncbi:hypothetical protein IAI10_16025 [Clostridium sp. 19966]|uniref:DUF6483 family protein n=1 Tax=Clostridium sp. 19966 TaxID=2768166 RepID=UPI0028DF74AF|nr:DUF6483 family protein [Clostridium sp. 19966]MDT8718175.1 hypothetical protein [Clostridium sp. 19966]
MYEQDYIERLIKSIGQLLVGIFMGKENVISLKEEESEVILSGEKVLEIMLKKYISEGKINEAEDILFDTLEKHKSPKYFEVALWFYSEINKLEEDELTRYNFSKQEIVDGLESIKKLFKEK